VRLNSWNLDTYIPVNITLKGPNRRYSDLYDGYDSDHRFEFGNGPLTRISLWQRPCVGVAIGSIRIGRYRFGTGHSDVLACRVALWDFNMAANLKSGQRITELIALSAGIDCLLSLTFMAIYFIGVWTKFSRIQNKDVKFKRLVLHVFWVSVIS